MHTDGGSRGNPGPSATGVYIEDEKGNKIAEFGRFIGFSTNNIAEYSAVVDALSWIAENKAIYPEDCKILFFMDSNLVCSQINGLYKVKNPGLRNLLFEIRAKEAEIQKPILYKYVPRDQNKNADRMVNVVLDEKV